MMLSRIMEGASPEQLKEFVREMVDELGEERCCKLAMRLYRNIYGCHFNQWSLDEALSTLVNEDGSTGPHWTFEETTREANERDIPLNGKFNEYDWCYVMNMVWSDYYKAITDDMSSYVRVAKRFLEDKDAAPGKAFRYYMSMR